MKYLFTMSIALFIFCCNGNVVDEPKEVYDFFSEAWLLSDSVNVLLKMNVPQTIETTEGDMKINFIASDFCTPEWCGTCDVESTINIFLYHEADSVTLPTIDFVRCNKTPPIIYKTANCNQDRYGYNSTDHENLIFSVRELYPYPRTNEESQDFYYNNKYNLNLTILNKCEP